MYYKEALNVNKSNSKELWKLNNSVILNKRTNNPIVKKLTVNNIDFEEPEGISEQFLLKLDKKLRTMLTAKHLMIILEPI